MGFDFGAVFVFAIVAVVFAAGGITMSRLVSPRFPSADKESVYECGERPIGAAWFNFNPRFYIVALIFVVFEVEIALTFPVVVVYRAWVDRNASFGWVAFSEIVLFTAILLLGLGWAWAHGDLDWVKELRSSDESLPKPLANESLQKPLTPDPFEEKNEKRHTA